MTKIKQLALAFTLVLAAGTAQAGKGGSAAKIAGAVQSGSVDAIVAEVERAEGLVCSDCVTIVTALTTHPRYEVREVAGWWFAKRPALAKALAEQFVAELASSDPVKVRNAADFLGATVTYTALPALRDAITRPLNADARLALVRAVKALGHTGGNPVLVTAMSDADAAVRGAAVRAWRELREQQGAAPVVALLRDADASVRADAATVIGAMREAAGVAALEQLVVADADPQVRKNAAWSLGRLGQASSRAALAQASNDASGFVRMTARAALKQLR